MDLTIGPKTKLYGIFGNPVEHSLSPYLHNWAFKHFRMDCVYMAFQIEPVSLALAFEGIRSLGIRGINVTIPFKEAAIDLVDEVPEDLDRLTGAINTVVHKDGKLLGYNTDGPGLIQALKEDLSFVPGGKDVLIIGAGGAARGAVFALANAGVDRLFIYNRSRERARGLAEHASGLFSETEIQYLDLISDLPDRKIDLVVNATSCGMRGNRDLPVDWGLLRAPKAAYDLVYAPAETPWLKEAKKIGIRCAGGLGMLAAQAALSFERWTGKKEGVHARMREALEACKL
mgnify:CR=1 FL=1